LANIPQQFQAVGTFADTSTQVLASALWASSNPAVATVTNDRSNRGTVLGQAVGNADVTACAGNICGTTQATVKVLTDSYFTPKLCIAETEDTITGFNLAILLCR